RRERQGKIGQVFEKVLRAEEAVRPEKEARMSSAASESSPVEVEVLQHPPVVIPHQERITPIYQKTKTQPVNDQDLIRRLVVAGLGYSDAAEPYRQLRTQVLRKLAKNDWNTLAVTSPNIGAGKTLTAVNLAVALAREFTH